LQTGTGAGPTWNTAGNYGSATTYAQTGGGGGQYLFANRGLVGRILVYNLQSTTLYKFATWQTVFENAGGAGARMSLLLKLAPAVS